MKAFLLMLFSLIIFSNLQSQDNKQSDEESLNKLDSLVHRAKNIGIKLLQVYEYLEGKWKNAKDKKGLTIKFVSGERNERSVYYPVLVGNVILENVEYIDTYQYLISVDDEDLKIEDKKFVVNLTLSQQNTDIDPGNPLKITNITRSKFKLSGWLSGNFSRVKESK